MEFHRAKRILVIKLRHIGDVLLTVPVLRALREHFFDAHISVLVNSGTEQVLAGVPFINEIILFDRNIKNLSLMKRYTREISFLKSIRKKSFDMTIDLTGGDRAAIVSLTTGAEYRLGWKPKTGFVGKKHVYTHFCEPGGKKHMVLQNLDIINQFGIKTENLSVDFYIPEAARTFIKRIFEDNNIPVNPPLSKVGQRGVKVMHVHPTSRWLFKCWRDEYMAEVITWLLEQDIKVLVTSSPDKKELDKARRILSLVSEFTRSRIPTLVRGGIIDLCGKTSIKQLGAISEASHLFLGVDSAPMHIAAAVGTPVIALFGPSGAFHWGPWDNSESIMQEGGSQKTPYPKRNGIQSCGIHTVIQRNWDCIPCGKDGCEKSKISKCLEDIKPDEVKEIIADRLKRFEK